MRAGVSAEASCPTSRPEEPFMVGASQMSTSMEVAPAAMASKRGTLRQKSLWELMGTGVMSRVKEVG